MKNCSISPKYSGMYCPSILDWSRHLRFRYILPHYTVFRYLKTRYTVFRYFMPKYTVFRDLYSSMYYPVHCTFVFWLFLVWRTAQSRNPKRSLCGWYGRTQTQCQTSSTQSTKFSSKTEMVS